MATATRFNRRMIPGAMTFDRSNPTVCIGDTLGAAIHRRRPGTLIAPIDVDPELWRWPVNDLEVTVIGSADTRAFADRVASMLMRDGAKLVAVCDPESFARIWKRN